MRIHITLHLSEVRNLEEARKLAKAHEGSVIFVGTEQFGDSYTYLYQVSLPINPGFERAYTATLANIMLALTTPYASSYAEVHHE